MASATTFYAPADIERLTGIPMNTLRAWERRYGVPKPQRGAGGHRIYSEADLQMLQWLRKQLNAGVTIGHAIATMRAQAPASANMHPEALVSGFIEACLDFDERRAEKILSDAFSVHTLERVCAQVITPALHEVGRAWADGRCGIAAEHFTSALLQAQLYALLRTSPAAPHRPLVFVASAPGEHHALAALMLTVLLRRAGWRALFFGQSLPIEDLASVVPELQPDVVMLSVTLPQHLETIKDQVAAMRQAGVKAPVVIGGQALRGAEDLPERLGCHFLGHDMLTVVQRLDETLSRMGVAGVRQ